MTPVDVVVVNYNAGDCLLDLLKPLHGQDHIHITLVDNASTDDSQNKAKQWVEKLIQNKTNKGFATACNQGASHGSAPVIFFVNPDCLLPMAGLDAMTEQLLGSEAALLGSHVVNFDGSIQRGTWRRLPTLWRVVVTQLGLERLGLKGINLKHAAQPPEAVNGACYAIKREAFESIAGFDDAYPLHFEDLDLFARLQKSGRSLACAEEIKVKHIKGHSSTDQQQVAAWKKQGLLRYFQSHRPRWEYAVIRLLSLLK